MNTGFITPMQSIGSLNGLSGQKQVTGAGGADLFKNIFGGMIDDAKAAENNLAEKQYLLATGQIDDAHTVPVAAAEAQLSIDMLVQLRNKAVETYNELMRINI